MVIGLTRARPRHESVFSLVPLYRSHSSSDWQTHRGAVRYEASCDLFGGFPGFAQSGGSVSGAHLRITDHFLLIDDGKPTGFGLPITWLEGAVDVTLHGRDEPGLRIFFRDGPCPHVFTIKFRGGLLSIRAHRRAEHALNLLLSLGMNDRFAAEPPLEPNFCVPWDETHQYEMENVVWTGATTGPMHVGLESAPADVWLTTKSLIWGCSGGEGINRVPLQLLQDVITAQVDDRQQTPAVYVSFGDETSGRYDLGFLFNRYDAERNLRERGAFLVGLRSRGIPLGSPVPRYQPWKISNYPVPQPSLPADVEDMPTMERPLRRRRRSGLAQLVARPNDRTRRAAWEETFDAVDDEMEFIDLADPVWPESHAQAPYLRIVDDSYGRSYAPSEASDSWEFYANDSETKESSSWLDGAVVEPVADHSTTVEPQRDSSFDGDIMLAEFADPGEVELASAVAFIDDYHIATDMSIETASTDVEAPYIPEGMEAIKEYEASSLAVLGEVLTAISDRLAGRPAAPLSEATPTPTLQASALAALIELTGTGELEMEEALWRKSRLIGLGEAGARLRSLLELRDAGHISDEDLGQKKSEITAQLSTLIQPAA